MANFDDFKRKAIDFGDEEKKVFSGMDAMERKLWLITVVFVAIASPMLWYLVKYFFF